MLSTNGRRGGDAAVLGLPGAKDTAGDGNSSRRQRKAHPAVHKGNFSNKLNLLFQFADRDLTISGLQCCEFGMFIPYTEFFHPGSNQKKRRGKISCLVPFL